jgi:hypothetical protein
MSIFSITANAQESTEPTEQMTISATAENTTAMITTEITVPPAPPHWVSDVAYENSDLIGNAELVEGQTVLFESESFSFISVQTKAGNIFYIFIDRRLETSNVYFLNKVDEYDLLSIIYAQNQDNSNGEETETPPLHPYQTEPNGQGTTAQSNNNSETTAETDEKGNIIEPAKKAPIISTTQIIILVIVVLAVIGLFVYLKISGNKAPKKHNSTIDEDEEDEDFPD